jgi:hypothetical protein
MHDYIGTKNLIHFFTLVDPKTMIFMREKCFLCHFGHSVDTTTLVCAGAGVWYQLVTCKRGVRVCGACLAYRRRASTYDRGNFCVRTHR